MSHEINYIILNQQMYFLLQKKMSPLTVKTG